MLKSDFSAFFQPSTEKTISSQDLKIKFKEIYISELSNPLKENKFIEKHIGLELISQLQKEKEIILGYFGRLSGNFFFPNEISEIIQVEANNNIYLKKVVSRIQACIFIKDGLTYIMDLGSARGTNVMLFGKIDTDKFNEGKKFMSTTFDTILETLSKDKDNEHSPFCAEYSEIMQSVEDVSTRYIEECKNIVIPGLNKPVTLKTDSDKIGFMIITPGVDFTITPSDSTDLIIQNKKSKPDNKNLFWSSPTKMEQQIPNGETPAVETTSITGYTPNGG